GLEQAARAVVGVAVPGEKRREARLGQPVEAFVLPERIVGVEADGGEPHQPALTVRSTTGPAAKKRTRTAMPIRWLPETAVRTPTAKGPTKLVTLPVSA